MFMNLESSVRKNDVDDLKNEVYYSIAVAKFFFVFFLLLLFISGNGTKVKVHKGPWVHRCQNEPRRSKP